MSDLIVKLVPISHVDGRHGKGLFCEPPGLRTAHEVSRRERRADPQ